MNAAAEEPLPDLLRQVIDKQQITETIYRYCRAIDTDDRDTILSAWHPEASVAYEGIFEGTIVEFVDWVIQGHRDVERSSHQTANVVIDLDGDRARSETYITACLRKPDRDTVARGRYIDVWVRFDNGWRIAQRRYENDMTQVTPR
jgi:hypothetical protein